jgi:RNase P subunit RPR2
VSDLSRIEALLTRLVRGQQRRDGSSPRSGPAVPPPEPLPPGEAERLAVEIGRLISEKDNAVLVTCPSCQDTGFLVYRREVPERGSYEFGTFCVECERGLSMARGAARRLEKQQVRKEEWKKGNPRNKRTGRDAQFKEEDGGDGIPI